MFTFVRWHVSHIWKLLGRTDGMGGGLSIITTADQTASSFCLQLTPISREEEATPGNHLIKGWPPACLIIPRIPPSLLVWPGNAFLHPNLRGVGLRQNLSSELGNHSQHGRGFLEAAVHDERRHQKKKMMMMRGLISRRAVTAGPPGNNHLLLLNSSHLANWDRLRAAEPKLPSGSALDNQWPCPRRGRTEGKDGRKRPEANGGLRKPRTSRWRDWKHLCSPKFLY